MEVAHYLTEQDRLHDDELVRERIRVREELGRCVYDLDECRVARYLHDLFEGQIGSGTDPVGFLIASHAALVEANQCFQGIRHLESLQQHDMG